MPVTSWSVRDRSRMKESISSIKTMLGWSLRASEKSAATSLDDSPNHCPASYFQRSRSSRTAERVEDGRDGPWS